MTCALIYKREVSYLWLHKCCLSCVKYSSLLKMSFLDVVLCSLVGVNRRFRDHSPHDGGIFYLKMEEG
jgi:hypothetical protein